MVPIPERTRSQSVETRRALKNSSAVCALYPPSFRFVLFMNSTMFLFSPHSSTVAIAVLRNKIRNAMLTPASSRSFIDVSNTSRSNSQRTMSNASDGEPPPGGELSRSSSLKFSLNRHDHTRSHSAGDIAESMAADDFSVILATGGMTSPTVRSYCSSSFILSSAVRTGFRATT